jgi:hypothetical protein
MNPIPTTKNAKVKNAKSQDVNVTVRRSSNSNEYLKVGNYWIRNFGGTSLNPLDINKLHVEKEIEDIINNEINNTKLRHPVIDSETIRGRDMLIVSDGYGFENHKLFDKLRKDICVVTVNHAARFWECSRFPNFFLMNNPTENAMSCLPTRNFPRLLSSRRTCHRFLQSYNNITYFYDPVPQEDYSSPIFKESQTLVDDYRNPVCAAISLAHKYQIGNIYLAFCSNAYTENRDGTEEVSKGLYQYPAQKTGDEIIDGNLFWYNFSNNYTKIFHTGIENSFQFSTYLQIDDFIKALI